MMNRKWLYMAAIALLVASSAPAQKITSGDSGLTTPGGGRTQLDLSAFPIEEVFGARLEGEPRVSLKGESLEICGFPIQGRRAREAPGQPEPGAVKAEQSNTSIVFGLPYFLSKAARMSAISIIPMR